MPTTELAELTKRGSMMPLYDAVCLYVGTQKQLERKITQTQHKLRTLQVFVVISSTCSRQAPHWWINIYFPTRDEKWRELTTESFADYWHLHLVPFGASKVQVIQTTCSRRSGVQTWLRFAEGDPLNDWNMLKLGRRSKWMQIIVRKAHSIRLAGIFDVLHGRRSRLAKFSIVPLLILAAASLAIFMAGTQWAFQHACKVYTVMQSWSCIKQVTGSTCKVIQVSNTHTHQNLFICDKCRGNNKSPGASKPP